MLFKFLRTSGNEFLDQFILNETPLLKWFPYNKFENIEYLDKGGFGIVYKATLYNNKVVLKHINHINKLNENLNEFLNEV